MSREAAALGGEEANRAAGEDRQNLAIHPDCGTVAEEIPEGRLGLRPRVPRNPVGPIRALKPQRVAVSRPTRITPSDDKSVAALLTGIAFRRGIGQHFVHGPGDRGEEFRVFNRERGSPSATFETEMQRVTVLQKIFMFSE